jgi:magnesium transporter
MSIHPENPLAPLFDSGDFDAIRDMAQDLHSADIAEHLSQFDADDAVVMLATLPIERQAEIIDYCELEYRLKLAQELGAQRLAALMNQMSHDDRVDILKALPEKLANQTLQAMAQVEREDIRRLASYPEGSAGAIMTTEYAIVQPELTVQQAIEKLRREAPMKETINRAYIVDEQRRLLGSVKLQTLILSSAQDRVSDIMEQHTHAVRIDDHQEYVAQQIAKYDVIALPVLDAEDRLVGIVTHDDAMDVLQQETTEDFHKTGTVGKLSGSILHASGWLLYRKRISWLVLLVFANIFSGAGIAYFEDTISAYVALLFFLPLLVGSGGNAGSQSATLMVRALATGEVVLKDWSRMLGRELLVAAGLGLTMALAVSLLGVFRGGPEIALVVALTMVLVVMVGSLIGMSLPFVLSRFKLDPATASAPLITTIADAMGVIIYFSIATYILVL